MTELAGCPFCPGEAVYFVDQNGVNLGDTTVEPGKMHFVMCTQCQVLMSGTSEDEVVSAWNRRVRETSRRTFRGKAGKVVCSKCGYGVGDKRWSFCPKCGGMLENTVDELNESAK